MKTFSTTDVRNRIGEFLDAGMVERIKLVRNNRVIGYFLPERDYLRLLRASTMAQGKNQGEHPLELTPSQEDTLRLYAESKIGASEAKADIGCDYRALISLLAERDLALPHVDLAVAEKMAAEALAMMNIATVRQVSKNRSTHRG